MRFRLSLREQTIKSMATHKFIMLAMIKISAFTKFSDASRIKSPVRDRMRAVRRACGRSQPELIEKLQEHSCQRPVN
jgi:hypothetical protein